MVQRLIDGNPLRRINLEHLHEQIHRHVHHPLVPLRTEKQLAQRSWLHERNVLHLSVHFLESGNHAFRPKEGAKLHEFVILVEGGLLVEQRIPPRQNAHKDDPAGPNVDGRSLVNHFRENFGSSETLRSRRMRYAGTGGIVANGTGPVLLLQMRNDGDDELRLEFNQNGSRTSSSFALSFFAFNSATSSSASPSFTSASPKSMRTPTPVSREYLTGTTGRNSVQKVAWLDITMDNAF